jgi:catechol 2,3-dioxygenase-like lactoylglutathione lyase family enzyme
MIEFIEQHNSGPSAYRDMYPEGSGRWGMHHVALIVDDCEKAVNAFIDAGHRVACVYTPLLGMDVFFMDCISTHGHMVEIYESVPAINGLYDFVAGAAREFDGAGVIRDMPSV